MKHLPVKSMSISEMINEFVDLKIFLSKTKQPDFRYHPIYDPNIKNAKKRIRKLSKRLDKIVNING